MQTSVIVFLIVMSILSSFMFVMGCIDIAKRKKKLKRFKSKRQIKRQYRQLNNLLDDLEL